MPQLPILGFTFVATVIFFLALFYAFGQGESAVAQRISRLRRFTGAAPEPGFQAKQRERVKTAIAGVGKLMPASTKDSPHAQLLLIRAGYRRPEALAIFRGMRLLSPAALVAAVYFSGLYKENPIFILLLALLLGYFLPDLFVTWKIRRRQHRLQLALPDALDLLVITVEAGLGLDQALLRVAEELALPHPELSQELQMVNLEMHVGKSRIDALRELANRTGVDDIKGLVAMLIQTDRFGTSIAQSLRVHSDDLRIRRRQRAEEMAAKTAVKMVPPLVFFIFPAMFVVILGPAVISLARELLPVLK
jgi:tight adherence protein C